MWIGCRQSSLNISLVSQETGSASEYKNLTQGLNNYTRNEEQTYLTLPEWYIVYNADEYAIFLENNSPSSFPYFRSIAQYWGSYCRVYALTREAYSYNTGYHVVLFVIGTSFSIENLAKGIYEHTIGFLSEWAGSRQLTEEDAYARKVAKEYGDFIHTTPWYEFPFGQKFFGLWKNTSLWGPHIIRKWERKFALSLEYGVKAVYGKLIRFGTKTAYAPQDLEIKAVTWQEEGVQVISIPRYEAFTKKVSELVRQGVKFIEIADNDEILVTVLSPREWIYDLERGRSLFEMPILTQQKKRIAVQVPVESLHRVLLQLEERGMTLEHIYDY